MLDPLEYWRRQLASGADLSTVGIPNLGLEFNTALYAVRTSRLDSFLARLRIPVAGKKVLDIGCGTGFWVDYWKARGARHVTGVDIAPDAIERLKARYPKDRFLCLDIGTEALTSLGTFDLVSAVDVLFHILDDEAWSRAIHGLAKCVATPGFIIISEHLGRRPFSTTAMYARTLQQYSNALAADGLGIVATAPVFFVMHEPTRLPAPLARIGSWYWQALSRFIGGSRLASRMAASMGPLLESVFASLKLQWGPSTHYALIRRKSAYDGVTKHSA